MKTPAQAREILARLQGQHPNADTELHHRNAFELLVATILSAQTTDVGVNAVTPTLFARYPDARSLAAADPTDIEPIIKSTGFFRQKAKAVIGMSRQLVERFSGHVPSAMADLVTLPGVGRKTANVVLGHALGVPGLPVDRHVLRVSNRIGLASSDDPVVVEEQLGAAWPPEKWTVGSDTLILHGRRICTPKPLCDRCAVRSDCNYFRDGASRPAEPTPARGRKTASRPARSPRRAAAAGASTRKPTR